MNTDRFTAGMVVDCLGSRLGTLRGVRGQESGQLLEVQPDGNAPGVPLLIPASTVAQVLGQTILLNVSCEEATRLGRKGVQQGAQWVPQTSAAAPPGTEIGAGAALTVPIVEEQLVPVTRWQEAGAVEVRKTVHTEMQEIDVPLRYEEATMERVPMNRVLAEGETLAARQEGDTLIVPVIQEEVVVTKRRVLVEELHITKQIRTITRHIAEPVRREQVDISHQGLEAHNVE